MVLAESKGASKGSKTPSRISLSHPGGSSRGEGKRGEKGWEGDFHEGQTGGLEDVSQRSSLRD